MMNRRDILLAGVGGQGTVLASKILARCAIARGEEAHTAETIGMAQRGGCVTSHVRMGKCSAPLIARGCADAIIAFEPAEAVRTLPYLKKGGAVIVNTAAVKPVTDTLASTGYEGGKIPPPHACLSCPAADRIPGSCSALSLRRSSGSRAACCRNSRRGRGSWSIPA